MNKKSYIIIGDDYVNFSDKKHVFTVSQFFQELLDSDDWNCDGEIIIGQGINIHTRASLEAIFESRSITKPRYITPLAPLRLTHKRSDDNVLITTPTELGLHIYGFDLALNDKIDRLSDHVTGQHIGAMLLMEAARQATIAVLELEYMENDGSKLGLILERFDSQFSDYMFPLPTSMLAVVNERIGRSDKHIEVTLEIEFTQSGSRICTMSLDVALYPTHLLEKIESRKARKAINFLLSPETELLMEERVME